MTTPTVATPETLRVIGMTLKMATDPERYPRSMPRKPELNTCPVCHGTGRNPEAPAEIIDDNGTCLVCCFPLHPLYAAHHGHVRPIA